MAATYPIEGHVRLSDVANLLDPAILDVETEIAELQLGVADTNFTGEDADRIRLALVLQVNDNVDRLGPGARSSAYLSSETRGPMSLTYRDIADARAVNPTAKLIVQRVMAGAEVGAEYMDMKSHRYNTTRSQ